MKQSSKHGFHIDGNSLPVPCSSPATPAEAQNISVAAFVEMKFIPDHVESKSSAGRTHYHAILKYILRPESVDKLFAPYCGISNSRLRALTGWPYLDDVRLCDIHSDHVRQLISCALTHGYSPQTVTHIKNVVRAIISHAKRERMFFGDNPISAVEMPPMTRRRSYNLTIAQAKALLNLMEYPEREVTLITISTGMSVSEICALQWKHVNLDQSMVCCGDTWIPPRTILVRKETQVGEPVRANGSRTRCISVSEALLEALRELKHHVKASDPNSFVIATRGGGQLSPVNPREMRLKRVGKDLDIPWLSWQVLKRAHEALLWQLRSCLTEELVLSAYCRSSERLGGWGIATQFTEVTALSPPAASNGSSYWQTPR